MADGQVLGVVAGHQAFIDPAVHIVTRTLTSAEILALFESPVELVPAVPGKVYIPFVATLLVHGGATPYDASGSSGLMVGNNSGGYLTILFDANMLGGDGAYNQMMASNPAGIDVAVASALTIASLGGNPIDGDGTLDVNVLYWIQDVS